MIVDLKLETKQADIFKYILDALSSEIDDRLFKGAVNIEKRVKNLIGSAIRNSDTYSSIIGQGDGILRKEFGIPDGASRLETIIRVWTNNIRVKVHKSTRSGNQLKAGMELYAIQGDFSDVISLPEASVITLKGTSLDWLSWLLTKGDRIIIRDYDIKYGNYGQSRAGGAIMGKFGRKKWGVPPQYSGTITNNWITQVIDSVEDLIFNIIQDEVF